MKNFSKNRKAQMEMSVGTIVTIVLLVTLLILGVVLIKNIFTSAKGVVDLTDQQLRSEIGKLFSEDTKLSIYPGTKLVEIKQGTTDGVGIGIKNLLEGTAGNTKFSYVVTASDFANCGVTKAVAESWITVGKSATELSIASGDIRSVKILFNIPVGSPLCTARFNVDVTQGNGVTYAGDSFDVTIKAK
ncbi:MAG: hypothetical protein AABX99_01730 [Nanoarchaeota archaeon]